MQVRLCGTSACPPAGKTWVFCFNGSSCLSVIGTWLVPCAQGRKSLSGDSAGSMEYVRRQSWLVHVECGSPQGVAFWRFPHFLVRLRPAALFCITPRKPLPIPRAHVQESS